MSEPDFTAQRAQDRQEMAALRQKQAATLKAMLLTLAIVAAPFVALLYSIELALGVLAAALGFTTWLAWHASEVLGSAQRSRLRMGAGLNGVMTLATIVILVLRILA